MHKLKPEYLLANTVSKMSGDRYLPHHCTTSFNLNGAEKFIVNFLKAWQLLVGGTTFLLLAASSSPAFAQTVLFNETFTGSSVSGSYLKGGTSTTACLSASRNSTQTPIPGCTGTTASGQPSYGLPTGGDAVGSGTLRLTSNGGSSASFIINNTPISAGQGREIIFDLFSYGGTGADGIGFFLIKGNYSPTTAGATGGSFGYAQKTGIAGLSGGYIGIAFDEFGNFSNGSEGRIGGVGTKQTQFLLEVQTPEF
jgi:hypothetical protein